MVNEYAAQIPLGATWLAGSPPAVTRSERLESLLERLQRGDAAALEAFISQTQAMAYRLAYSILADRDRCQDVMQEVYLTVYQKIGQLREPAAFKGWFSRILVNRCRQELRGRKFESLDELPESKAPSLDGMADRVHDRMQVQAAMAELAPHDRAMLTMREVLELSYQEIAESLEIPLGTVRSRLFHARQRLLGVLSRQNQSDDRSGRQDRSMR